MRKAGVKGVKPAVAGPGRKLLRDLFVSAVFASSLAIPRPAHPACLVTNRGIVNCNADTTTTHTTNIDGSTSPSSARTQRFHNGVPINAAIQPGVAVSGFGLRLTEKPGGKNTEEPITMHNQGEVTTGQGVNTLQLSGDGGPISYSGDGSVINTSDQKAALDVKNLHGNISVATGAGAISGATGINARTTASGALTIMTGSGLVSGSASEGILATAANGALNVTVGSGGVLGAPQPTNGFAAAPAVMAISQGKGSIVIDASGPVTAPGGHGISALQGGSARGGILVTGNGDTMGLGAICPGGPGALARAAAAGETGCSGIRGVIQNKANTSDVAIDWSGNALGTSAAIHAKTAGNGNVIINVGANSRVTGIYEFGILTQISGTGSASISTSTASSITTAGTGILVTNLAGAIPAAADSVIAVATEGTIASTAIPVDGIVNPKNPTGVLAGILAAYVGGVNTMRGGTATPNPNVNGTVSVNNNAIINMAGGDGILALNSGNGNVSVSSSAPITVTGATSQDGIEAFSAERGNIFVTTSANVTTGNGNGIQTTSVGAGTTTINVLAGTVQGASSGESASSKSGAIAINNSATIQNLSGQPGSLAVATTGAGNASLVNNAGGVVVGTLAMSSSGGNTFINAGIWNTLGNNSFADSSITNSGTVNVFGSTTFGGLNSLTTSGTLNLAPGSAVGTLTIPGNLALQSSALYTVALAPPASSVVNVGGTASLAGSVQAVLLPGAYAKGDSFTILQAHGLAGTFSSFTNPGFSGTLTYTPTDVLLTLTGAKLGAGGGLNANQQNVANGLNNFFNSGGTLPGNFRPTFGLTGGSLGNALTQLDGEVAADAQRGAFDMMSEFLNLMLDPFLYGRAAAATNGGQAIGFAPEVLESLPPDLALAYASVLKAPPPEPFAQRWSAWGASYGGSSITNGDAAVGSNNLTAQTFGLAAGVDYHYSPETIFGFALGGGGTDWGLASGGTGRGDAFQTGVYGITGSGPAYLAAALAFANHWITTTRSALNDALTANFAAQSYGGRLEGGYRYAVPPSLGVTPYAALQVQAFHTPAYGEADLTGGGFGLSYAAMNATDVRTEIGARLDDPAVVAGMPLILRGRLAWAHDFASNPSLSAAFEALPGSNFVVNGAPIPQNSALASAGAELFVSPRITLIAKFDGEFAPGSKAYAGSGTLRYMW